MTGKWPKLWKKEIVTPVPKVYPTLKVDELRKISGLMNFNKIAEKIIAEWIISDMKSSRDISQYGYKKGLSINHYLINVLHQILSNLDRSSRGESCAAVATYIDFKEAFYRQCPVLGIKLFITNNVRPSLIPMLVNYFQGRQMTVKWLGTESSLRNLPGFCLFVCLCCGLVSAPTEFPCILIIYR